MTVILCVLMAAQVYLLHGIWRAIAAVRPEAPEPMSLNLPSLPWREPKDKVEQPAPLAPWGM